MVVATYHKFDAFVGELGLKTHNLNVDTFKVALARATDPPTAADTKLGDITQPTGTGYAPIDTANTYSAAGGTGTMVGTKCVFTAGAGDWQSFQYVILYNEDDAGGPDKAVCWWDYGAPLTLGNGETFTIKFNGGDPTGNILTIA